MKCHRRFNYEHIDKVKGDGVQNFKVHFSNNILGIQSLKDRSELVVKHNNPSSSAI